MKKIMELRRVVVASGTAQAARKRAMLSTAWRTSPSAPEAIEPEEQSGSERKGVRGTCLFLKLYGRS